jgi:hypothetical protein
MNDLPALAPAPRRISRKVRAAIDLMVAGEVKTITEAAAKVGLSREHLSRELSRPDVTELMHQKVRRSLATAAARASHTKVELLDSPSERVRDSASSFVLGLAGIRPATTPSVNVNVEIRAGYVIDLSDDPPAGAKVIDHV